MFRKTKIRIASLEYKIASLQCDVENLQRCIATKEAEALAMAGLVMQREAHIKQLNEGRTDAGQY